jgi:hypothetical protein
VLLLVAAFVGLRNRREAYMDMSAKQYCDPWA